MNRTRFVALSFALAALIAGCNEGPSRSRSGRTDGSVAGELGDAGSLGTPGSDAGTAGPGSDAGAGSEAGGLCNGTDDDRDGNVDEGCPCEVGSVQACYGGDPGVAGRGACDFGSQRCEIAGEFPAWGPCTAFGEPSVEICGGGDEDCDAFVDEGCDCSVGASEVCYETSSGAPLGGMPGVGICRAGSRTCNSVPDGRSAFGPCMGAVGPGSEICGTSVDEDCDGRIDEGCTCPPGITETCYETPSGVPLGGMPGVGRCRTGIALCVMVGAGSELGPCEGAIGPAAEECMTGSDEDCDGLVDEGCVPPPADCTVADVLFLVDTTGSMGAAITDIRRRLRDDIAPALDRSIGDLRMAVASYRDFPIGSYGSPGDLPFQLHQASTSSLASVQAAIDRLAAGGGNDTPESATEALYQSATGVGYPGLVPGASCPGGTVGAPCFRASATPIIVLITDAPFHEGPSGYRYSGISPAPRTYAATVSALNGIGAMVIGVSVGFGASTDLTTIARDTGAMDSAGRPIVLDGGFTGSGVGSAIVDAVRTLCGR